MMRAQLCGVACSRDLDPIDYRKPIPRHRGGGPAWKPEGRDGGVVTKFHRFSPSPGELLHSPAGLCPKSRARGQWDKDPDGTPSPSEDRAIKRW